MRIRITKWTGSQSDGIVLATCDSIIRVAVPGCDDSVEFSHRSAHWFSEDGEPVEIDFAATETRVPDFESPWTNAGWVN